jgi:hypothetical protein
MRVRTIPLSPWKTIATHVAMVFALLVSLAACKPMDYGYGGMPAAQAPMTDAEYGYDAGYRDEEMAKSADYVFEDDLERSIDGRTDAPAAPPVDLAPTGSAQATQPTPEPNVEQPAPESADRKVVYTATLQLAVYELEESMAFAEAMPERYAGWIQSRYENQITIRIPAERLREAMEELATLGMVLQKTLQAADVTAEYTDLESRLIVLAEMEERLLALLEQAKTVEESLKIRQELDRVRLDLELSRTRMRSLSELISFSTLTIYLSQRGPISPVIGSNDPFPWVDDLGVEATEYR